MCQSEVDVGKILALYNADWTIENIAGDTRYSEDTVEKVIEYAKFCKEK